MKRIFFTLLIASVAIISMQAQDLKIHKIDGTIITIQLNAIDSITFGSGVTGGQGQPCHGTPTVTDIDGNVYNTVLIGDQCWMKDNLITTNYRNGTSIIYPGNDNTAWENNTSGAYAWYNNDISWKESYGALYNWYAVNNSNGLCPAGWHVPSDTEWTQLVDYMLSQGFPNSNVTNGAGNALKSCRQIDSPLGGDCNTSTHPRWEFYSPHHGFDAYGFSAFPGVSRVAGGNFDSLGIYGSWWSSTENSLTGAWNRYMNHNYGYVGRFNGYKGHGFSIRCLMDN